MIPQLSVAGRVQEINQSIGVSHWNLHVEVCRSKRVAPPLEIKTMHVFQPPLLVAVV